MDVHFRLRAAIWVLLIGLWGVMVYQYLGDNDDETVAMKPVANPFPGLAASNAGSIAGLATMPPDSTRAVRGSIAPAQPIAPATSPETETTTAPAGTSRVQEERSAPLPDPPVPAGFVKVTTPHFNIYSEEAEPSDRFRELIENLHTNLMLDLAPFSPWARDERVSIFLFQNQETFRQMTGRPPWSGGASSVARRRVYIYKSPELPGILAHELTHIYFDGFFRGGVNDPLWLSEGMATLVQVERGLAAPTWLRENLQLLSDGGGLPLDKLMAASSTSGWPDEAVRLWYAEAYSVVRYLIRTQHHASFYRLAVGLRDGAPMTEALYRAYGPPFNRVRSLELAWRGEISHPRLRAPHALKITKQK